MSSRRTPNPAHDRRVLTDVVATIRNLGLIMTPFSRTANEARGLFARTELCASRARARNECATARRVNSALTPSGASRHLHSSKPCAIDSKAISLGPSVRYSTLVV